MIGEKRRDRSGEKLTASCTPAREASYGELDVMGTSSPESRFDLTAEADPSLDWGGLHHGLDFAAEHFDHGVGALLTVGDLHGVRYDPAFGELLDAAKHARELARQLAARAFAHAQEQRRDATSP